MEVSIRMKTERDDEEQRAARTHIVLSTNCCIVDLFHIVNTRSFILEVREALNIERRSGGGCGHELVDGAALDFAASGDGGKRCSNLSEARMPRPAKTVIARETRRRVLAGSTG